MAAKKKELATIGVKLNLTQTEFDLIEKARSLVDERKIGPCMRKASLKWAREVIEAAHG